MSRVVWFAFWTLLNLVLAATSGGVLGATVWGFGSGASFMFAAIAWVER